MATSDDRRLIDNEGSTTVDKFYGNKGGKDVQISLADAAAVLAERINKIGGLFYTGFIEGAFSSESIIKLAEEVVNALPTQERLIFAVIHQNSGERIVSGYYYADKAYGTINVYQANNLHFRVDIVNNEYVVR